MSEHQRDPSPTDKASAATPVYTFLLQAVQLPFIFAFPALLLGLPDWAFWIASFGTALAVACLATPSQAQAFARSMFVSVLVFTACIFATFAAFGYLGQYLPGVDPLKNRLIPCLVGFAGVAWNVRRLRRRRRLQQ